MNTATEATVDLLAENMVLTSLLPHPQYGDMFISI